MTRITAFRFAARNDEDGKVDMKRDKRNLVDVLKAELEFLEKGGYRHTSPFSAWPPLIFEDSPSCLNFYTPDRPSPCTECVLIDLVPLEQQNAKIPCRHIPLNEAGETLDNVYRWATAEETETIVGNWLKATIRKLEGADAEEGSASTAAA